MNKSLKLPIIRAPFYYVRHGLTDWNTENRAMGQADVPLNAQGILQALSARNLLIGSGISTICHSPLSRAKQTAEIFNEILNCPLVEIEELREFHLGPYQGMLKEQWFKDWRLGQHLPETESYEDFIKRATNGINKALSYPSPILVVAHGGTYWALEKMTQVGTKELPNCTPAFYKPLPNGEWETILLS